MDLGGPMRPVRVALLMVLGLALSDCSTIVDHKAGGAYVNTSNAAGNSHIGRITQFGYRLGLKF